MIADTWTIVWKDWKELLLQRGGMRRGWLNIAILVAVFGVFLPLQMGDEWVRSPLVLASWAWVPLLLVSSIIADSFAGERERRTLETLLATRMPPRPILFGKVLAAVGYAWGVAVVSLFLGLVTVNATHWSGRILMYSPAVALAGMGLSLALAGLAAGAGVLVSLRAQTVRQAQQTLSIATMVVVWVPIVAINLLPRQWLAGARLRATSVDARLVMLVALVLLAFADVTLIAVALARFRTERLILD